MCLRSVMDVLSYGSLIINYQVEYLMKIEKKYFKMMDEVTLFQLVTKVKTCSCLRYEYA